MDISLFLAKFWGWYLLIFFFILSYNPTRIKQIFENMKDQKFSILTAFIAIVIGLLNILCHNIWRADFSILITLFGWISLGIGILLFVFPGLAGRWLEYINVKLVQVVYVILFLLGIYLINLGYGVVAF